MTEAVLREQVGDHLIRVLFDESGAAGDPRDADNLGIMFCWHPRYELGDEQFKGPQDVGGARTMAEVASWLRRTRKARNIIPLFLYDHSGISISAGATISDRRKPTDDETTVDRGSFASRTTSGGYSWDTSMVGFIYTTNEQIELLGAPLDSIDRQLRGEVTEYNDFITGQVFGYIVTKKHDPDCDDDECDHDEEVDSCWGFLGKPEYAMEEAKASIPTAVPA